MNNPAKYKTSATKRPTFYFIGVTTAQSSMMKLFPLWMEALDRPEVTIQGVDLEINAPAEVYRQIVTQIKDDPLALGGLITTHKIDLFNAARDMFDYLDPHAQICREVSCLSKRNGQFEGHAKDPLCSELTLRTMLGQNYFTRTGGHVLCFGSGGAATAIALQFIDRPNHGNRPQRFVVVDLQQTRLDHLKRMVASQNTDTQFEYILNEDPRRNDTLMANLPAGSLVINATGMGKDRPGSPITEAGLFPKDGIAWELNYRGERTFMHQALAQANSRQVRVEDGWLYFLHGWTQIIAEVLHTPIEDALFERLARIAETIRS